MAGCERHYRWWPVGIVGEYTLINHCTRRNVSYLHYTHKERDVKFLKFEITLQLMFSLFKKKYEIVKCSFTLYRNVFIQYFNLRRKKPLKDACNRCDANIHKIGMMTVDKEKVKIENEHQEHLDLADYARQQMREDLKEAFENEDVETLTFDLQKVLPLPRVPSNIMYFKNRAFISPRTSSTEHIRHGTLIVSEL